MPSMCSMSAGCWLRARPNRCAPMPKWSRSTWETTMNDGATELLRVEALSVRYGAGPVVHGVSLALQAGTVAALLGANGAGKSSTLRAIAGLGPSHGTVR